MTLTMYDSTSAADLPVGGDAYGAYTDGLYANVAAVRARFPDKPILEISAVGKVVSRCYDVEPGCVWPPANAPARVAEARAAGLDPIVYCGRFNWPDVIAAFQEAGEAEPRWWVAHYTNSPHLCSDECLPTRPVGGRVAIGTQYGGDLPGHYDMSYLADDFFGTPTPLAPNAQPIPVPVQEDEDMKPIIFDAAGGQWVLYSGGYHHLPTSADTEAWVRGGAVTVGPISGEEHNQLVDDAKAAK